jgi:hypothetical protein
MGILDKFKSEPSIEQLQEKNERAEVELSLEQKRAAIRQLKESGLKPKDFGFNWQSILSWIRQRKK